MHKPLIRLAAAALFVLCSGAASAEEYADNIDTTPSAGAMAFDLLIVRPLGLVATVLGTGLFVVQLPLSLIQGEPPSEPSRKLVIEPAKYTFQRPLGEME
ncbi:MAG: hypothetical protein ACT4PZ_07650 [Panacagrimonas sp.]